MREPSPYVVEGASHLTVAESRYILRHLGIVLQVHGGPDVQDAVGWSGSRGQSLAVSMLLRGDGSTGHVSAARVTRLAEWWLTVIPADVQDGPAVAEVLRRHLWYGPRVGIADELREADATDRAAAADAEMIESMILSIRDRYRGRESEASELHRCLLLA